ncbi:segregation protein A [Thermanaerothrix daxensis]|uniref:Selenide, water dikinase n=1 Tax=Thermanaerothrix daxensis TaxID=869279 RepID=A0A0P6XVL9_9CHLR|nr:segregation protein A [Thermanaerothrix daxensis]
MAHVLRPLRNIFQPQDYPDLLVGLESPDDAAVWRVDASRALVVTTDFFTPIVDDPYAYGAIAAANSLSDVYAMGGVPFLALNIAALPPSLPHDLMSEILRGGAEKAREAGVVIAGGHTIQDKEPKYGLVVLGWVDLQQMFTKGGACPGDVLVLSKPLGFGVTTTALKRDAARPEDVDEAVAWMMRLNRSAAEMGREVGVRGATDVTGFSLLGHGLEMALASRVGLRLVFERIPFIEGARTYAEQWMFPGGASDNRLYFGGQVRFAPRIDEASQMLLFDPQTSGGLLMAVPKERLNILLALAEDRGEPLWVIGEVIEGSGIEVV